MYMRIIAITLFFILLSVNVSAEIDDGNSWLKWKDTARIFYIGGYLEGIGIGMMILSTNIGIDRKLKSDVPKICRKISKIEIRKWMNRYAAGTIEEIKDEVSKFFVDYGNRNIKIKYAVEIVLMKMAGDNRLVIDNLIKLYKDAAIK